MSNKKKISSEQIQNISGGTFNRTSYIAFDDNQDKVKYIATAVEGGIYRVENLENNTTFTVGNQDGQLGKYIKGRWFGSKTQAKDTVW
jgi:hypothetical protein